MWTLKHGTHRYRDRNGDHYREGHWVGEMGGEHEEAHASNYKGATVTQQAAR